MSASAADGRVSQHRDVYLVKRLKGFAMKRNETLGNNHSRWKKKERERETERGRRGRYLMQLVVLPLKFSVVLGSALGDIWTLYGRPRVGSADARTNSWRYYYRE